MSLLKSQNLKNKYFPAKFDLPIVFVALFQLSTLINVHNEIVIQSFKPQTFN